MSGTSERGALAGEAEYCPLTRKGTMTMKMLVKRLWADEEGQDLTEYALLLVLVALAAIGSLGVLASAINSAFSQAASNLTVTTS